MAERDRPWSVKELAAAAGIDPSVVRKLLIEGRLDGYKIGNAWAIPADVGQRWMDERRAREQEEWARGEKYEC